MNVSLYIIGTELTRGIITDKHTQVIASELTKLDFNIKRSVIVPDDGSIEKSIKLGAQDSDILIITGGLGPTSDDMTRNIVASLAGVELEKNQSAWDTLYARVGERIHGANEIQAYIPKGFDIIPNRCGTAAGFKGNFDCNGRNVMIICMPGPPAEMQPMFYEHVLPFLSSLSGHGDVERDEYSVFLIAEAKLEDMCKSIDIKGVNWGTRFQNMKISLYLSGNNKEARMLFARKLKAMAGQGLIVDGDVEAVDLLTDYLKSSGKTISCAESCTCGLLAKTLTDKAGSSSWFWGGASTYSIEAKQKILSISKEITDPVTERCAREMAEGMLKLSGSDYAVSVTGYAGPATDADTKEVGTVYFGFASKNAGTQVVGLKLFTNSRDSARRRFTTAALVLAGLYAQELSLIDIASKWLYI